MGVKGLTSYVKNHCPGALVDVNLQRLGSEYHRRFNKRPVLVVDCNPFIRSLYINFEYAFGGQWVQYLDSLKSFLATFQRAGFELVIMFDSVIEKKKMTKWIERRKNERKLVSKIFQSIKSTERHPPHNLFHIPTCLSSFTRLALKSLGATVHNSTIEVDREIYQYYRKHGCYGILGKDTDFMIYDVDTFLHMEYSNGRIKQLQLFRKDVLCHHLGIPPNHLPLFACLVGNDTVLPDTLSQFHNWVTRQRRDLLIPSVAEYLKSLQLRDMSKETLDSVAHHVSESLENGYLFECVQEYMPDSQCGSGDAAVAAASHQEPRYHIDSGIFSRIKTCHHNLSITDFVMQCIVGHQITSNMSLEDDTDELMPSSAIVLRPIRQRMYGILLRTPQNATHRQRVDGRTGASPSTSQGNDMKDGTIEEMCAYAGNRMEMADTVPGLPLDISPQPLLEDLWPETVSPATRWLRLKTFFSCLHCSDLLVKGILDFIQDHHLLLCCILHFFLLMGPASMLRSCDVDAFISQAVCLEWHNAASLKQLHVNTVKSRAIHMATIFVRGMFHGCSVNSTCGLPFKMDDLLPWHSFDGKLFHSKYIRAESGQSPLQLCDNSERAKEQFLILRHWIVTGTRLQE